MEPLHFDLGPGHDGSPPLSGSPPQMTSLPFTSPLEEEEEEEQGMGGGGGRPGSSLSTSSRSSTSRIPVLARSTSLRLRTPGGARSTTGDPRTNRRGLVRSASFVSTRGLSSSTHISPSLLHHTSAPTTPSTPKAPQKAPLKALTPELSRRAGGGRRTTPPDRKTQSYAGLGLSWHPSFNNHNHHNHNWRPNFLPVGHHSNHHNHHYNHHHHHHSATAPATPGSQPETPVKTPEFDDNESVKSGGSVASAVSCDAGLGRRTTPQWEGRSHKFLLHCRHAHDDEDPDKYLTPTQRAARTIRQLKRQLAAAQREVEAREAEVAALTRDLVELRLVRAPPPSLWQAATEASSAPTPPHRASPPAPHRASTPQPPTETSEAPPPPSTTPPQKDASGTPSEGSEPELRRLMENLGPGGGEVGGSRGPLVSPSTRSTTGDSLDLARSLADSGHYDDLTSPALSTRGSSVQGQPIHSDLQAWREGKRSAGGEEEVERLREEVERLREEVRVKEQQLRRAHLEEYNEMKERHNDRVEVLLAKLSDANLKYFELRPQHLRSQERVRELEAEVARLRQEVGEAEARHQKMYLQMFLKGQQAARLQADDDTHREAGGGGEVGGGGDVVVQLMQQLTDTQEELEKVKVLYHRELTCHRNNNNNSSSSSSGLRSTELDPEVTLQFLKSAIYYYLTDKDNARGHLRAIESILGYTDRERHNMNRASK